jgi:hypothetical protein
VEHKTIIMLKFNQLVDALNKKNIKFEAWSQVYSPYRESYDKTIVQFSLRSGIWVTFEGYAGLHEDVNLFFLERYSQKTGNTSKSWKVGHNYLVDLGLEPYKY